MKNKKNLLVYMTAITLVFSDTLSAESKITPQALTAGGVTGKLNALARLEEAVGSELDISYLASLEACAADPSTEVREKTAHVVSMFFVDGKEQLGDGVEELLVKLANDPFASVRYAAIYYGLAEIESKSDVVVEQLLTEATTTRDRKLYEKIAESLSSNREQAAMILDQKITERYSKPFYTIYETMTGKKPPPRDPSLDTVVLSVDEVLSSKNSRMRLSTLKNMSKSPVNKKHLNSLMLCCTDASAPVRSLATKIIGENFVPSVGAPEERVSNILIKMAKDDSVDVRYSAVKHGLSRIENKSDEMLSLLLKLASKERSGPLFDCIAASLIDEQPRVAEMLDEKLKQANPMAYYEVYEVLTGTAPPRTDRLLDMPSSMTRLFAFEGLEGDLNAQKQALAVELERAGIESPDLFVSDGPSGRVLLLKTRITRDRLLVEKIFSDHPEFSYTQSLWLTAEQEKQVDALRVD